MFFPSLFVGLRQLRRVLAAIEAQADQADQVLVGAVEHDPTYKLIVEANNLTAEINSEIGEPRNH